MNKKILSKILIASMLAGGINFTPAVVNFDVKNLKIISVAHAEIKNVIASDSVICDFGEDDERISNTVKNLAKMRATQAAKEKAGVFVKSFSRTVNGMVTDDDISVYSSNNIEIIDVTYKKIPIQAHDVQGNDIGKIGFAYEATVTAKIDISGLSAYIERDYNEKNNFSQRNKDLKKSSDEINRNFDDLRQTAENKTPEQIKSAIEIIDNKILSQQKIEETNKVILDGGDFETAINLLNQAIEIYPDNALAYAYRGELNFYKKNYRQAIEDSEKAFSIDDKLSAAYEICGLANMDLQNYNSAIFDFNQSIRLGKDSLFITYSNRGLSYYYLKNYEKAIEDFNKSIELNPKYAFAYCNRGLTYIELKKYDEAMSDFNKSIQLYPDDLKAYFLRGRLYSDQGQFEKAVEDFTTAIETKSKIFVFEMTDEFYAQIYFYRAYANGNLKNYEQAIKDYSKAIELFQNYILAYYNRGIIYSNIQNYDAAIKDYSKVIESDENNAEVYGYRANAYIMLKKYNEALKDLNKAIQLDPNVAVYYFGRGGCYYELGEKEKSEADFAKAKELGLDI